MIEMQPPYAYPEAPRSSMLYLSWHSTALLYISLQHKNESNFLSPPLESIPVQPCFRDQFWGRESGNVIWICGSISYPKSHGFTDIKDTLLFLYSCLVQSNTRVRTVLSENVLALSWLDSGKGISVSFQTSQIKDSSVRHGRTHLYDAFTHVVPPSGSLPGPSLLCPTQAESQAPDAVGAIRSKCQSPRPIHHSPAGEEVGGEAHEKG